MEFEFRGFRDRSGRDAEVPWDRILAIAPLVVLVLLILFLGTKSVYTVQAHEKAVVLRFGEYHATVDPGLRFCIPLVDQVLKVSVEEHSLRLPFGAGASRPGGASEEETLTLTADLNAASVEWTIQWKATDPYQFLIKFHRQNDPAYVEQVITTVAQAVMNRLVGDYSIDEVLTEKRGAIAAEAREETQRILDNYASGIGISDLQMQRVTPPARVKPAFDEVNASIQRRDKLENEAMKERNQLLPKAYAEKDKLINEAKGYADRRRAEAEGEIEALLAKYHAYERAPDATRQRLYIEAMQEILGQVESKVIVDSELQGILPLLPLDQGAKP